MKNTPYIDKKQHKGQEPEEIDGWVEQHRLCRTNNKTSLARIQDSNLRGRCESTRAASTSKPLTQDNAGFHHHGATPLSTLAIIVGYTENKKFPSYH